MKILKTFGIVVGIHVFALLVFFANPGCSSTSKPAPSPSDTVTRAEPAPTITVPNLTPAPVASPAPTGGSAVPPSFNPDAPATYDGAGGPGVRFTPTRPNSPAASAVLSQPVENVTPVTTYTVKDGDSLWTLQKKFHVSFKDIAAENHLRVDAPLHQGQKLIIPTKAATSGAKSGTTASAPKPAAARGTTEKSHAESGPRNGNGELQYTVKSGDTIETIARHYEVKWKDLAVHNNIDNPARLRPGTVLSIPGWKSTGGSRSGRGSSSASSSAAPTPTASPSTEPPAVPNLLEPEPAQPAPQAQPSGPANSVPVINVEDSSSTAKP